MIDKPCTAISTAPTICVTHQLHAVGWLLVDADTSIPRPCLQAHIQQAGKMPINSKLNYHPQLSVAGRFASMHDRSLQHTPSLTRALNTHIPHLSKESKHEFELMFKAMDEDGSGEFRRRRVLRQLGICMYMNSLPL